MHSPIYDDEYIKILQTHQVLERMALSVKDSRMARNWNSQARKISGKNF